MLKNMISSTASLIALSVALALSSAAGAAEKDKGGPKVSAEMAKPLKAAQDDIQAKRFSDALTKLKDAEGNPKKQPYDQHVILQLETAAYVNLKDYPGAARTLEAQLKDGFLTGTEEQKAVRGVAQLNYQLKNYDKSIEYGNQAIRGGYADAEMVTLVGQAYYLKGDWKGTLKFEQGIVDGEIKEGRAPKLEALQLILSSCVKLEDNDCSLRALEKLVQFYPKNEYWQQLLYSMFKGADTNDKSLLQTYRLMAEVDVLKRPEDYTEMAQLAIEQGSPGEAQHILERGVAKNVFTDARSQDKNKRLLEQAKKAAAADQASLPKLEKEATAAPTGDKDIGLGVAYLGYQQYDKAAAAIAAGIQKGGLKARTDGEAKLMLGIADLKAGKKDEAIKAFRQVKGDPTLERLANLWSLRAKGGPSGGET